VAQRHNSTWPARIRTTAILPAQAVGKNSPGIAEYRTGQRHDFAARSQPNDSQFRQDHGRGGWLLRTALFTTFVSLGVDLGGRCASRKINGTILDGVASAREVCGPARS